VDQGSRVTTPSMLSERRFTMLGLAILCLLLTIVFAFLGFGVAATATWMFAKVLFFVFLVLFVLSMIGHSARGRPVP
jgi:uncharacterized membrane protein YtjA (UPF0391 family)